MGNCSFCGKSAGLLRSMHIACEDINVKGYKEMVKLAAQAASKPDCPSEPQGEPVEPLEG